MIRVFHSLNRWRMATHDARGVTVTVIRKRAAHRMLRNLQGVQA